MIVKFNNDGSINNEESKKVTGEMHAEINEDTVYMGVSENKKIKVQFHLTKKNLIKMVKELMNND